REVYQNGALYFDPYSPEDCAEKILSIFDYRIRQSVISKGREQIKKYSWRKMAQETLKVYGS
ncbi:MAG: glycosyltransferase family 1 protein, partial [Nitrososphaerota archaeon]